MKCLMSSARAWFTRVALCGATALLVACGGGGSTMDAAPVPAPARAAQQPLAEPAAPTADQAMDWAESTYPGLFPAAGKTAGSLAPYTYRHYPNTGNYLGISSGSSDVAVYLYGPVSGNASAPVRLAPLADYTCLILPASCASFSSNIAAWGDSLTPPFAANLGLLYPSRTVFDGGISSQSSYDVVARMQADTAKHGWVSVFWFGHNNKADPEQVKRDMATAVASLSPGNHRFVVMGLVNKATAEEFKGTVSYQTTVQLNNDLAAIYPNNYIDIRTLVVNHYNPGNAQDVIDFQHDVPPSSLRHDVDHFNNAGSVFIAERVRDFINAKGW